MTWKFALAHLKFALGSGILLFRFSMLLCEQLEQLFPSVQLVLGINKNDNLLRL